MPIPGISLFGFMDEKDAVACINEKYVVGSTDHEDLVSYWEDARRKLEGHDFPAGTSEILDMTPSASEYLEEFQKEPHVQLFMRNYFSGWEFKMVEIDPLIAVQTEILDKAGEGDQTTAGEVPSEREILESCFPKAFETDRFNWYSSRNSLMLRAEGTELNVLDFGFFGEGEYAGILFGNRIPYVQVVIHDGRSYLFNGYHRAYGLRKAGVTHIPCLLKPKSRDISEAGVNRDGSTFLPGVVLRENAPTIAHLVRGLGAEVMLKKRATYITVNWAKHTVYVE